MNPPPPGPATNGSVTPSVLATATAPTSMPNGTGEDEEPQVGKIEVVAVLRGNRVLWEQAG